MAHIVSLLAVDFATLRERVLRQAPLADLVEIRLDAIGHPGRQALAALFADCPRPVIVAVNGPEAFGTWAGGVEQQLALLRDAAAAGAAFVDVDWTLAAALGDVSAPCRRIVSRHELAGTPADLDALLAAVRAGMGPEDVAKVVTHAADAEDGMRMLRWLREHPGVVGFCSGEAGRFTRLLAPIFGSPFTYCAPARLSESEGEATAPGQIPLDQMLADTPPGGARPSTAVYGVVGNPVGHSLSPAVQGAGLRAAGLDAVYVAFQPTDFDAFLDLADDPHFRGFSVTVPFKERAFARAVVRDDGSERTGAVNTLFPGEGGWHAANTDTTAAGAVIERAVQKHGERRGMLLSLAAARTLVLGAGGAARAVVGAILARGADVTVAGIPAEQADALGRDLGCAVVKWDAIPEVDYDVLVHVTPVGMYPKGEECVVPTEWIRPDRVVVDAVYRPFQTKLLRLAAARGCTCVPGREWFVRQAADQFRIFTGVAPDVELMGEAFARHLLAD